MDGNHPNRKKDKLNPYTLSIENDTYYIDFTDGQGVFHKTEISMELYAAFNSFELDDISQMNVTSRHLEQSELTEETLTNRAANPPETVEDHVFRRIKQWALDTLNEASKIGHILDCPAFNALYDAAAMEITRNSMKKKNKKHTLSQRIKEAFSWKN